METQTQNFSEDLRHYVALLWHWAWLLALATALSGILAFVISRQLTPVYQAATSVLVNEAPATKATDYSSVLTSERLTQTYSQLLVKQPVLQGVIDRLGLDMTASELARSVTVQPVRDTQLIEVRVEDTNPERAALIADALVAEFAEQIQQFQTSRYAASKQSLETQLADLDAQIQQTINQLSALSSGEADQAERDRLEALQAQYRQTYAYLLQSYESVRLAEANSLSSVVQAEPAFPPETPIRPRVFSNTLIAALVGLMVAIGLILLVEALDDTLRTPEDVSRTTGLPVLGLIARYEVPEAGPITISQPRTSVAEAFRSLRTNIQFASVDKPVRRLLITSPSPSDGKSNVAINLGAVTAQGERRVVIVDADLRRPRLHKLVHLTNRRGLSDLFVQPELVLDGSLQKTEVPNLLALPSGSLPPNPSELLGSEKMQEILKQLSEQSDVIIIDSPPVLAVTDAAVLSLNVDGVLLVVKPGVTKLAACKQAVEQLRRVGANLLGVVLNEVELKRSSYYYYKGYYYAYYESYGESAQRNGRKAKNASQKQPNAKITQ